MRLQEFCFDVEYLPGPENVVADHLSRHTHAPSCAGFLAYAMANKVMDVVSHGGDVMVPSDWSDTRLQELWRSGDGQAIAHEPCTVCGEEEGHAHMVLCDTCNRPYHLQCCIPPRSEVPAGEWHCHVCDEAYANAHELERARDPILFPRGQDPFHPAHADSLALYVQAYSRAERLARADVGADARPSAVHLRADAADAVRAAVSADELKRIRRKAQRLRLHPTQPDWYLQRDFSPCGRDVWLALPPPRFRWGLIGAYHDRVGHGGVNQTLRALRMSFAWPGIKDDVAAYIAQCHPCQLQRLQHEQVPDPTYPCMSKPFEHLHVDLAGPLPYKEVRAATAADRRKGTPSTEKTGTRYIGLIVDYFTKAAELVVLPDKAAATVARALHDSWLCRYGVPEWLTTDNGREFGGAFAHLLARFGIEHVTTSAYHPQANGAVERLVRTFKTMLTAKSVGAVANWVQLMPQIQGEYMSRVHSSTGFSPNELVYGHKIFLPPPIGALHARPSVMSASVVPDASPEQRWIEERGQRLHADVETALSELHAAQRRNVETQVERLRRQRRRGGRLAVGDLAYLLEPSGQNKQKVSGPFVVHKLPGPDSPPHDQTVTLRTTERVSGQGCSELTVHRSRVARCTTVADVLEKLVKQSGLSAAELRKPSPDNLLIMHTAERTGGVSLGL